MTVIYRILLVLYFHRGCSGPRGSYHQIKIRWYICNICTVRQVLTTKLNWILRIHCKVIRTFQSNWSNINLRTCEFAISKFFFFFINSSQPKSTDFHAKTIIYKRYIINQMCNRKLKYEKYDEWLNWTRLCTKSKCVQCAKNKFFFWSPRMI